MISSEYLYQITKINHRMRITFVLPPVNLSGGIRVLSIYADALKQRGHEIFVVSVPPPKPRIRSILKNIIKGKRLNFTTHNQRSHFDRTTVTHHILDQYRPVVDSDVPDADIVIATFWTTAEWVSDLSERKGKKVYFIQGYEIHDPNMTGRVEKTLKNSFYKIVVSDYLYQILTKKYGEKNISIVPNGVDINTFNFPEHNKPAINRFGFIYSPKHCKGSDIAIQALQNARQFDKSLEIIAFGDQTPKSNELPDGTKYMYRPNNEQIKNIYGSCTAWIVSSRNEGFGLPILEAMACRTPVIATKTGAAPTILGNGGGELIDIGDVSRLIELLHKYSIMSHQEWKSISDKAYNIACRYKWSTSIQKLEQVLKKILSEH